LTSAECVAEGGTFALGVDCPSLCGVVELDLCAPGECEVIVPVSSGIGGTSSTITYVAADEARCLSRDGRWLGYKSELGYTSAQCPPTQTFPLTGGSRREGDLTGDGRVGADDLLQLFANWGSDASRADLDGSGKVGVDDLIRLLSHWD
jgi:hypothetical protein